MDASHISPLMGSERAVALNDLKAEGKVFVSIMDADHGDQALALEPREALTKIRDQMAEGKWLRVVMPDGSSDIIYDRDDQRVANRESAEKLFDQAIELAVQLNVTGG